MYLSELKNIFCFRHYNLCKLCLIIFFTAATCSCSFVRVALSPEAESFSLESAKLIRTPAADLVQIQENPFVYRTLTHTFPAVYLTPIRYCGKLAPSPEKNLRRLFVGMQQIRIISTEKINSPSVAVLKSSLSAKLDERNLSLTTLSSTHEQCLVDYVLWTETNAAAEQNLSLAEKQLLELLAQSQHGEHS